jgi:NADP-reducing hydrogenase subunit HndC
MMGSGGMIVMDEDDCMVSVARFYLDFTVEESCGKCTPCRVGNKRLFELLETISKGKGTHRDLDKLRNLGAVIKETSLCGLGQTLPTRYFQRWTTSGMSTWPMSMNTAVRPDSARPL